jgi:uncharacterized protein (TIGR02145 family)
VGGTGNSGGAGGACGAGCVQDVEGHVYETVTIGSQTWMKQNLAATQLDDGTPIPLVEDDTAWISSSSFGYCYYENKSAFASKYGALYNWYAVATGKLCPAGWHVPSGGEWLVLIAALGGKDVAGGKLKEAGTAHWMPPNTGATNAVRGRSERRDPRHEAATQIGSGVLRAFQLEPLPEHVCCRLFVPEDEMAQAEHLVVRGLVVT